MQIRSYRRPTGGSTYEYICLPRFIAIFTIGINSLISHGAKSTGSIQFEMQILSA